MRRCAHELRASVRQECPAFELSTRPSWRAKASRISSPRLGESFPNSGAASPGWERPVPVNREEEAVTWVVTHPMRRAIRLKKDPVLRPGGFERRGVGVLAVLEDPSGFFRAGLACLLAEKGHRRFVEA